jgi:hypothetical protein
MEEIEASNILRGTADSADDVPLIAVNNLAEAPQHVTLKCIRENGEASPSTLTSTSFIRANAARSSQLFASGPVASRIRPATKAAFSRFSACAVSSSEKNVSSCSLKTYAKFVNSERPDPKS